MRTTASIVALTLTFVAGMNIRQEPETIYQVETIVRTERIPADVETIIAHLDRDVVSPETDEANLYTCWTQLVDLESITDWHAEIAYIARKWAGDTCQALDHYLIHGRY
jgi:hypothetical protein